MNSNKLNKFKNAKICVFGDVMLDRYLTGSVTRVSPEAPVPVVNLEDERHIPGGAANVAANIRGLGAESRLLGVVGKDNEASILKEQLVGLGIDPSLLVESGGRSTTLKSRVLSGSHQIARVDRESTGTINDEEAVAVLNAAESAFAGCHAVVVSDYGKGLCSSEFLARLITKAKSHNIPVLVDPKGVEYEKYSGSYVLTPNKKEALEVFFADQRKSGSISAAGEHIAGKYDVENLIITLGAEGMALFSKDTGKITIDAGPRNVFDVTGAGDTVIATLAVGTAAGLTLIDAAHIANIAAGCVVEDVGTTAISFERLKEAVSMVKDKGIHAA
ncbi:MAG: D-glycero-beta-D-manno-heptose-7-phosphate kinase [Pyrinomonadaceae bacterium]|nr:D-glycero-beta-D-manno-heptose-7-phosphate kinase [Pyrinomonadaceae bacterium]